MAHRNAGEHLGNNYDDKDKHLSLNEHVDKIANNTNIPMFGMTLSKAMDGPPGVRLDENEDGRLSWWEFFQFSTPPPGHGGEHPPNHSEEIEEQYMVTEEQHANFNNYDLDGDGFISPEELVTETIEVETQKFHAADADHNGILNHNEIESLLHPGTVKGYNPGARVLRVVAVHELDVKDKNDDEVLSPEEFFDLMEGVSMSEDEKAVFESLDVSQDNVIDLDEYMVWESGHWHTEDSLAEALKIADKDEDKFVTVDEFVAAGQELATTFAMPYLAHWHEHHFDEL